MKKSKIWILKYRFKSSPKEGDTIVFRTKRDMMSFIRDLKANPDIEYIYTPEGADND